MKHRYTKNPTDDLRINLENLPLNSGLKYNATIIILNHLQVPIEFSHQLGKHNASTVVDVSLVIGLNNIISDIQRCHSDICSNHIPLWDCLPILNSSPVNSYAFFCPLTDYSLRTASKHGFEKKTQKVADVNFKCNRKCTNRLQ
jgi:hypothetical protein